MSRVHDALRRASNRRAHFGSSGGSSEDPESRAATGTLDAEAEV